VIASAVISRLEGREIVTANRSRRADDSGATAVEYALVVSLIATVIAGSVALLGLSLVPMFLSVLPGL
jgi:Flp pilus assembly pilin Flp